MSRFEKAVLALLALNTFLLLLVLLRPSGGAGRYQSAQVGGIPVVVDTRSGEILRPKPRN